MHQRGRTFVSLEPQRFLDFLQIRGTQVEMPAIVAVFGLKADRGRLPTQSLPVITPLLQVTIDGAFLEHRLWGP